MIPGAFLAKALLRRMPLGVHAALIDAVILAGGFGLSRTGARRLKRNARRKTP
jgi:hypothetical protein